MVNDMVKTLMMFSSPRRDFFILTMEELVKVDMRTPFSSPSWGFLYINLQRVSEQFLFFVLVPSWGFLYINGLKVEWDKLLKEFSSPRGDFFILTGKR